MTSKQNLRVFIVPIMKGLKEEYFGIEDDRCIEDMSIADGDLLKSWKLHRISIPRFILAIEDVNFFALRFDKR